MNGEAQGVMVRGVRDEMGSVDFEGNNNALDDRPDRPDSLWHYFGFGDFPITHFPWLAYVPRLSQKVVGWPLESRSAGRRRPTTYCQVAPPAESWGRNLTYENPSQTNLCDDLGTSIGTFF